MAREFSSFEEAVKAFDVLTEDCIVYDRIIRTKSRSYPSLLGSVLLAVEKLSVVIGYSRENIIYAVSDYCEFHLELSEIEQRYDKLAKISSDVGHLLSFVHRVEELSRDVAVRVSGDWKIEATIMEVVASRLGALMCSTIGPLDFGGAWEPLVLNGVNPGSCRQAVESSGAPGPASNILKFIEFSKPSLPPSRK